MTVFSSDKVTADSYDLFFVRLQSLAQSSRPPLGFIETFLNRNRHLLEFDDLCLPPTLRALAVKISADYNNDERAQELVSGIEKTADVVEGLALWHRDDTVGREKEVAFTRMRHAYVTPLSNCDIAGMVLASLPPCIGSFDRLEELNISYNPLRSLPETIGQLTNLQRLNVGNSYLTSLPESICQLRHLTELHLCNCRLASLPEAIGQLSRLRELSLGSNNLTAIPTSIGRLVHLRNLQLSNNNIGYLPAMVGRLLELKYLDLENNGALSELPLSLGQAINLCDVFIRGTRIANSSRISILTSCRTLRDGISDEESFPVRLRLWLNIALDHLDDVEAFMNVINNDNNFTGSELRTLNEWLARLEQTSDFVLCQQKLVDHVYGIFKSLIEDVDFRKFFFVHAEINNSDCQDRAAMSLNEIYTYWCLRALPNGATAKMKLVIIIKAAKTFTLRRLLSERIDEYEKRKERPRYEPENVEIYLHYETCLKERLGLLSAIENMSYRHIGQCNWINEKRLAADVEENYVSDLIHLPEFTKLTRADNSFKELWNPIAAFYDKKLEELENNDAKYEEFVQLHLERKEQLIKTTKAWITQIQEKET